MVKNQKKLLTKNNQPIKEITQAEINDLQDHLEQLASWQEPLNQIQTYFQETSIPMNKKKLVKQYHAQASIFTAFNQDFAKSIEKLNKKLDALTQKEKVRL
ncbi:MAG TPA: hypothetical protein H9829_00225 [Candidatus Tetragenococcus pullicola]|nr:hypothetical protein [Candidatus Tetragenococcus pullicola]